MSAQDAALLLVVACPIVGAFFALLMPSEDRLALRHVGMAAMIASGVAALYAVWLALAAPIAWTFGGVTGGVTLRLDALSALVLGSLSIGAPIALRAGAPRVQDRSQFYVVTLLFAHGLLAAAVLVDVPLLKLSLASIASVPMFALVALYGGPQRGTTTYRAALIWIGVDVAAISAVALLAARAGVHAGEATAAALARGYAQLGETEQLVVAVVLAAPGLLRLAAGPFSVWLQPFLDEAPVSAVMLVATGAAPLGALLVIDVALASSPGGLLALAVPITLVSAGAALLSGVIVVAERELRRIAAQLWFLSAATVTPALIGASGHALAAGLVHVVIAGACLTLVFAATEAVERRFETRDATGLLGLSASAPLLAAVLGIGLAGLVGLPGIGAGGSTWVTLGAAHHANPPAAAGGVAPVWIVGIVGVAYVLAAAGVLGSMRRLYTPPPARGRRELVRLTMGQALRLLFPTVLAIGAGLASASLTAFAEGPARARVADLGSGENRGEDP